MGMDSFYVYYYLFYFRVLFKWIVHRDPDRKVFETNSGENTIENIIEQFKKGRSTHAQIFQILCL
jgi:hypothetical protein